LPIIKQHKQIYQWTAGWHGGSYS